MDKKMFCFQCEQTVGCTGCTGNAGACGKKADTARLQDELTGALISLARAVDSAATISKRTGQIIIEGLFTTVTNVNFDNASIENMIQKVRAEKERRYSGSDLTESGRKGGLTWHIRQWKKYRTDAKKRAFLSGKQCS